MAGGGGGAEEEIKLEYTPTWIVALVCTVIICISLFFERFLHRLGKRFMRKNQKPLFEALQKMKEELMLMGFISLLLVVFQGTIQKICIPASYTRHLRPCKGEDIAGDGGGDDGEVSAHHRSKFYAGVLAGGRRLLAGGGSGGEHCAREASLLQFSVFFLLFSFSPFFFLFFAVTKISKADACTCAQGKVPLLSIEAIHQLHIFIFALATTHVLLSALTMVLGGVKIRQWKHWEDSIHKEAAENASTSPMITHVHETEFIRDHFRGIGKDSLILGWLHSFFKHIFGSVTKSDYRTLRLGFVMAHCKGNLKFNFHKYMVRAVEADFKKVLLFSVGTKLVHIISQLAHEVAEKHSAIEGDLVVTPSDDHFWFGRPRIMLILIHLILFHVAFEIAYFFWILVTYGYRSCIIDGTKYIVPRLIICVVVQIICSYSTLPLYAIVTQMGSSFKPVIFEEHVQEGLVGWAQKVKMKGKRLSKALSGQKSEGTQLQYVFSTKDPMLNEIEPEIVEAKR
ncbi:MLO-like protein 1 [Dendrobium catenatum]|uniref:MLO-like protein n=1 Tax=Dendrobium catenatum TaxID=906689 RepID=A0A2I0VW05_9ASPA|nr:MLO-like protein 1 [Dendrobium catenatum]